MRRKLGLYLFIISVFCSCKTLNRNRMLQSGEFYNYSQFSDSLAKEYKISPGDVMDFRLYSNDGFKLIDVISLQQSGRSYGVSNSFIVEYDGLVKFPVLGRVNMKGYTIRQAEMYLEDKYSEFYNKPFVYLSINNKRVFVFSGGRASVVSMKYDNETVFEVLADYGGMPEDGKADKIKIIRGDLKNPSVYILDLSTLSGVKHADLVMQGNDIIYIETRKNLISKSLGEVTPYLSAFSTALLIYGLIMSNILKFK